MAMFSLNLLRISLDLCEFNKVYQFTATKFLEHFLYIAGAMNNISSEHISLWDDEDNFFYDIFHMPGKDPKVMKVKSIVGIIPFFAVEPIREEMFEIVFKIVILNLSFPVKTYRFYFYLIIIITING